MRARIGGKPKLGVGIQAVRTASGVDEAPRPMRTVSKSTKSTGRKYEVEREGEEGEGEGEEAEQVAWLGLAAVWNCLVCQARIGWPARLFSLSFDARETISTPSWLLFHSDARGWGAER